MIIRPSTTQVYLLGGENIDGAGLMGNHVGAVQFTVDTELQDVSFGAPSILANSTLPVSCSRMGADVYSSLAGQHVILVGGKTGSNDLTGSVKVLVGDFIGADIVWETGSATSSWELPKPVYGMTVHVMDDTAYILGGFTSGAFTTGVLSIPLDPITGRPSGTWVSEGENIITNPVCGATPMHVDGVMYMILEFSDGTPISQIAYVGGQFQGQTRISQDTDPTGPNYFPFKIDGGHIFAIPNADQVGGTLAAEIAFNTGSSAFEILNNAWQNVGTGPGLTTTVAKSGSSAVYGTVIFVGCGISGSTTSAGEPQLHATNIVMQAPAEGEFTTQGKQFGPTTIRPVYPILDDVYSLKSFDAPQTQLAFNRGEIRGYRPGLRDTEVRGTWRFMLGMSEKDFSTLNGSRTDETAGVWFRQARIELVTNTGVPLSDAFPSRTRKWLKSSLVPAPDGFQKIALISGSNQWDVGLNETELYQFPDYGRSVGITAQTSSSPASFAVQTFITGALFTYLSGVGHEASASNPPWFLGGNGFGTPYIPDSSMSLGVTGTALEIDASASQEIYRRTIGQQTIIPNANTMTDYLRRVNYAQTTQQIWEEIQASLLSGTA
jgi:hypothetical protein